VAGRNFLGHVNSLQAGSRTVFGPPPAENARGNYVEVVRRIPLKITFDHGPDVLMG
jgi:membrane fusion protein (multidrug efflux system)